MSQCGRTLLPQIPFYLNSDVDKGSLYPKSFHGHLQTLGVRALHKYREKEPRGHLPGRQVDATFSAEQDARGRPQLHQGHGGRAARRRGAWWFRTRTECRGWWCLRYRFDRGAKYALAWHREPEFGTKCEGVSRVHVTSAVVTGSALVTIFCMLNGGYWV